MRRPTRHVTRFLSDQKGAALLELAVALPVVMFIGLGAIEYGNMVYTYHLIENGVRDVLIYDPRTGVVLHYRPDRPAPQSLTSPVHLSLECGYEITV